MKQDLIKTYKEFSDDQLLEVYQNLGDYTIEAKEALTSVIDNRGGIENMLEKKRVHDSIIAETERIKQQIRQLRTPGVEVEFLKTLPFLKESLHLLRHRLRHNL